MLPIQKLLINYNHSARNESPKYIVIHDVGTVSTAKNNRDYFAGGNRQTSADFFVDSTNIIQIIDYHTRYSWAIGDGAGKYGKTNGNTISIEMCLESNYTPSEQTIQNTLDLTKYLMNEFGLPEDKVIRHYDCSLKQCPKSFSANNWTKWFEFKKRLNNQGDDNVLEKAVLLYSKDDYFAGGDVALKYNCAIFIRPTDKSCPNEAFSAKELFVIGGSSVKHPKEIILSGNNKFDTCAEVNKFLG